MRVRMRRKWVSVFDSVTSQCKECVPCPADGSSIQVCASVTWMMRLLDHKATRLVLTPASFLHFPLSHAFICAFTAERAVVIPPVYPLLSVRRRLGRASLAEPTQPRSCCRRAHTHKSTHQVFPLSFVFLVGRSFSGAT